MCAEVRHTLTHVVYVHHCEHVLRASWWGRISTPHLCSLPVVLVCKDKEALAVRGAQGAQPLVGRTVLVLHLLQYHAAQNGIRDGRVFEEIQLQAQEGREG